LARGARHPSRASGVAAAEEQPMTGTLTNENDLAAPYMAQREQTAIDDSLARLRARVAAREGGQAGAPDAASAANPQGAPAGQPAAGGARAARPPAMRTALDALRDTGGAVAADLGRGIVEAPRQILGGMSDAIHRTFMAADGLANWLNENVADLRYGDETSFNPLRAAAGPEDAAARGFAPADSTTGGIVREAARFLTAFVPASRAMTALGAGRAAGGLAAGAISDFMTADPNGERLADLWNKAGLPSTVLTDYLAKDETDGELEGRFKNALEGAGLGALTEGVMLAARAVRSGLAARRAAEKGIGEGMDALAAARAEYGALGADDLRLLGDPAKPLVTVEAAPTSADTVAAKLGMSAEATETGVPDAVAARGLARAAEDAAARPLASEARRLAQTPKSEGDIANARARFEAEGGTINGFGPVFEDVRGDYAAAVRKLAQAQDGEAPGVLRHPEIGEIALPWGKAGTGDSDGEGLAKLLRFHPDVVDDLPDMIAGMSIRSRTPRRVQLESATHRAGVRLDYDGAQKTWLLTAFKKDGEGRTNAARETVDRRASREAGANPPGGGTGSVAEPRIAINFARIEAPEDVKQVLDDMAQAFAGDVDAARRGVQTNAATKELADRLGMTLDDLLARRRGEPLNAEQSYAARRLLNASADKLLEVARLAAGPNASPADQFQFRKMMAIHHAIQAEVLAARTETARALQAWSIPAGIGSVERARAVTATLDQMGGTATAQAMAQRLARLAEQGASPQAIDAAVRKGWGAATMDAVREAYVLGLLWSPTTHIVNTTSNLVVGLQQIQERALAGDIGAALARGAGAVAPGEAAAMTWGLVSSLKDAFRLAGQAARDGYSSGALGKLDQPPLPAISANAFDLDQAGAIGRTVDFLGSAVRVPGHLLAAQDAFFQSIGYRAELHAQAWRQAYEEGLRGADAARRMAAIVTDPPEHIRLKAADAAAYATFTNEPGDFAKKILALRNHTGADDTAWANLNPLFVILPFVKTPANILSYTFERTPLAPLVARWRDDVAAGGARADLALARVATGTSVMLLAADLASSGQVTGAGPKDPGEREALTRQGWQPYSIKVGDTYAAYNRLDPFGMLMGFAATMDELAHRGEIDVDDMDEWNEVLAGAINAVSQTIVDKTFFTGLAQVFEVLGDPQRYTRDYVNGLVGSFVPFTSALGFAERAVDPATSEVNTPWDAVMAKIPGLSDRLTPRRNLWGETVRPQAVLGEAYDLLSPARVSRKVDSPIDAEMTRLGLDVRRIPKKTSLDGVDVSLRDFPEAYDRLVVLAGNELKHPVWGLGLKDYLDAVVSGRHEMSPIYRMASDGKDGMKAEFIKASIREWRGLAAQEVLADPRFAELAALVGERRAVKAERRLPVTQQPTTQ
jgi:hypothetical protein